MKQGRCGLASVALAMGLVACGGGGGGDPGTNAFEAVVPPTGPASARGTVNADNFADVGAAIGGWAGMAGSFAVAWLPVVGVGGVTLTSPVPAASRAASAVLDGRRFAQSVDGTARRAGVLERIDACTGGGTVTTRWDDGDLSGTLTAGDALRFEFSRCREGSNSVSGQAAIVVVALGSAGATLDMQFTALRYDTFTLEGRAIVEVQHEAGGFARRVAWSTLTLSPVGQVPLKLNFTQLERYDASTGVLSTALRGGAVLGEGSYWLMPIEAFTRPLSVPSPSGGRLAVVGRDSDTVLVVATPSTWRYEYFPKGQFSAPPQRVLEQPKT